MGNVCCPMGIDNAALLAQAQHRNNSSGIALSSLETQQSPSTKMVRSGKMKDDEDDGMTEVEKLKQRRREAKAAKGAAALPKSKDGPVLEETEIRPSNIRRLSEAVDDIEWVANDDGTFSNKAKRASLATIEDAEDEASAVVAAAV